MNELIKVDYNTYTEPTINARDLHDFLQIGRDFSHWIKEKIEYLGFIENLHYYKCSPNMASGLDGGQNRIDYLLTVDTSKHISMVCRGARAKEIREHFIMIEKAWNSPDKVSARNIQLNSPGYPASIDISPLTKMFEQINTRIKNLEERDIAIESLQNSIKTNILTLCTLKHLKDYQAFSTLYKAFSKENEEISIYELRKLYKNANDVTLVDFIHDASILRGLLKLSYEMLQAARNERIDLSAIW